MNKLVTTCDRCGREERTTTSMLGVMKKHDEFIKISITTWKPFVGDDTSTIDLCPECYSKFKKFMNEMVTDKDNANRVLREDDKEETGESDGTV